VMQQHTEPRSGPRKVLMMPLTRFRRSECIGPGTTRRDSRRCHGHQLVERVKSLRAQCPQVTAELTSLRKSEVVAKTDRVAPSEDRRPSPCGASAAEPDGRPASRRRVLRQLATISGISPPRDSRRCRAA
jgi:hypothetical protein